MSRDDIDRLRLARAEGVGPVLYRRLLVRFGSAAAALDALPGLARARPAIPTAASAARELEALHGFGARMLFLGRPGYPPLLALLDDAPPALSLLGDVAALRPRAVAIVGSRNASLNGRRMARQLAQELAAAGFVVVSGMARGVDAAAHEGAMAAGRTVACVAGGLDRPYPPEHAKLQARIAEAGAVVSELPLGTTPQARHFPRRNRVIAGLSLGVVVVEAAARSGSLITARLAQETGRDLFAVPGSPLDPRCRGANDLIRQGAVLTEGLADIMANLTDDPRHQGVARAPMFARPGRAAALAEAGLAEGGLAEGGPAVHLDQAMNDAPPAAVRGRVIDLLGPAPATVDDLIRDCQFSAAAVVSALIELELNGLTENLPGNRVALLLPADRTP